MPPIRRALISVSDKSGLIDFARALSARGIHIVSTGGTAKSLSAAGLEVNDVATITNFPEMMDGRVKTLHPKIHGGLLAVRDNPSHHKAMTDHNITAIDLLVVNLYPFEETVKSGATAQDCIENIDIGGPAMIRSAAKNHHSVTVVTDPSDYAQVLAELVGNDGETSLEFRRTLAAKAYARTAAYDSAIAAWFAKELDLQERSYFTIGGKIIQSLRYGENPQQKAAVYESTDVRRGVPQAQQIQGKELSYNNINDADAALECVAEFDPAAHVACVIVKHANPCGVALGASVVEAYHRALTCDPLSAFGGIIAVNHEIDGDAAREMVKLFTEVIIAPAVTRQAQEVFAAKKNIRVLLLETFPQNNQSAIQAKSIIGGLLVQTRDTAHIADMTLQVVSKRAPTTDELRDLKFAYQVAKFVKSNAIVYARDLATVGIGAGQMSRLDSARIAVHKNKDASTTAGLSTPSVIGSVVASDAFFPFADGLLQAAEAGATAVIQPGGSIRDDEVIAAADAAGLAMIFTGTRHFRH